MFGQHIGNTSVTLHVSKFQLTPLEETIVLDQRIEFAACALTETPP